LAGDKDAFAALVEPRRWELDAPHAYRMIGSGTDAADAMQ
jgi:hypothetical protein